MDIVENRRPKLTRVSFKVAEKASSDGATNKQCLIDDQKNTKTTITKLPTDLVDILKPTLSWVSDDVAEEASTDGTMNVQCLSDDQNYKKTTNMKMPMDYLEIPGPPLTRGSWNWPRRPETFVSKMNSVFIQMKFQHKWPE